MKALRGSIKKFINFHPMNPISIRAIAAILRLKPPISATGLSTLTETWTPHDNQPAIQVEDTSKIENGVILVRTDNPQVEMTSRLIMVHADWANGMVPQELSREGTSWQFYNGDLNLFTFNGEAEAGNRPIRAGSLNDKIHAWPGTDGQWSGDINAEVKLVGRIRVGYKPLTVQLAVSLPRPVLASNSSKAFQIALDPDILLVPVEVARFFSSGIPLNGVDAWNQMALWDQVPIIGRDTDFRNTDGGTGETKFVARGWEYWPTLSSERLYTHQGWVSPDSIWGKAGVRFRLVNFIDIETDGEHTAPTGRGLNNDTRLRENHSTLMSDPRHIDDKPVLRVIIMHRIGPSDAPEIGRALIGLGSVGVSWSSMDRFAVLAHEIGHLITDNQTHSSLPNNVMNDPGPGTDITPEQVNRARAWASGYASFWQRP